jgi:hypothetical protein
MSFAAAARNRGRVADDINGGAAPPTELEAQDKAMRATLCVFNATEKKLMSELEQLNEMERRLMRDQTNLKVKLAESDAAAAAAAAAAKQKQLQEDESPQPRPPPKKTGGK